MRTPVIMGLAAAALALAAAAGARPPPPAKPSAPSAERAGQPASYRSGIPARGGHGYSARERRMLDCLASDPRYDPAADRVRLGPGESRPCEVKPRS